MPQVKGEILRVVTGSTAFETKVQASDVDYMGIFIEGPDSVFSIGNPKTHLNKQTQAEGERAGASDEEHTWFSLRRFLHLACQGNPNVLNLIMGDSSTIVYNTPYGQMVRNLRPHIVSKVAGPRFLGFFNNQLKRFEASLRGEYLSHMPKRPELIEKYGYDTKYAAHAARLALQGAELMQTGEFAIPMIEDNRNLVISIREGQWQADRVITLLTGLSKLLEGEIKRSKLPEKPDKNKVQEVSAYLHVKYWEERGMVR